MSAAEQQRQPKREGSPKSEEAVRQLMQLVIAIDEFGAHMRSNGTDLSRTEMLVLIRVYLEGPIANNELARRMGIGKSSMSAMVTRLVDANMLDVHQDVLDGRRRSLTISDTARNIAWSYCTELADATPGLVDPRSGRLVGVADQVVDALCMLLTRADRA